MPLPAVAAGAPAGVRGTLVAVHFRDAQGFATFSLEQPDGSRVRGLGQLPAQITLQAVVRISGTWTRHAEFGWQVRVNTFELVDRLDRRGIVAFLAAYSTHLGPVRAADVRSRSAGVRQKVRDTHQFTVGSSPEAMDLIVVLQSRPRA